MRELSPIAVLSELSAEIPADLKSNMIIIGSLAAGYHFFGGDQSRFMRTKDADSVLRPRSQAPEAVAGIAKRLLALGWWHRTAGEFNQPGTAETPDERLAAVRLHPPNNPDWFIEFLTLPDPHAPAGRRFLRVILPDGHYGLPSFEFLPVCTFAPAATAFGIFVARPPMMALANLLEHDRIKPDRLAGTSTLRSNKDLGRVLALARLSRPEEVEDRWAAEWEQCLRAVRPDDWRSLARRAGNGLSELLANPDHLIQAAENVNNGLLASSPVTGAELRATGLRLIADAIAPLIAAADA